MTISDGRITGFPRPAAKSDLPRSW
jgi:hypothetical protein